MTKKIIAFLTAAVFCAVFAFPAFAAGGRQYIYTDAVSADELSALEARAAALYETYGIEAFFVQPQPGETAFERAEGFLEMEAFRADCVVLAASGDDCAAVCGGRAVNIFTDVDLDVLTGIYLKGETNAQSIEYYLRQTAMILSANGVQPMPDGALLPRLVDHADLLTDDEEAALLAHLDEISERQQFDVVVATVDSLEGMSVEAYADDFYDYNGYGYGESRDGALLLLSMSEREYHITTTGYGITALTDYGMEYISDQFVPYLSRGDYMNGFTCYADLTDELVTRARNGEPFDVDSEQDDSSLSPVWLPVSLGGGAVIGQIPLSEMKRKLKSVRRKSSAADYFNRERGMTMGSCADTFLYSNVRRVHIDRSPNMSSGGGGSSTHFSSSGMSHGGHSGKF